MSSDVVGSAATIQKLTKKLRDGYMRIRRNRIKNQARELLARVKLYIDLWFGDTPHFNSYVVKVGDGILQEWYDNVNSMKIKRPSSLLPTND